MEITSIPSDNLYKFIAFTGLVIVIAVNYFWFSENVSVTEAAIRTLAKSELKVFEAQASVEEIQQIVDDRKEFLENPDGRSEILRDLDRRTDEWTNRSKANKAKYIIENAEAEVISKRYELLQWFNLVHKAGSVLGLILFLIGVGLWYSRIQKIQDQIIKAELHGSTGGARSRKPRLKV